VLRLNETGPEGLTTRKAPGKASILNGEQRARLAEIVETGPIPAARGVERWRLIDLGNGRVCGARWRRRDRSIRRP